ncbi:hypothetical protein N9C10_03055 [Flavobacteriaceae bacterium]|nr:hypothetical protein [Flavobacteriaceae bacterium]
MIDIERINQIEETRKKVRKEIYTKIYEQFSRKIMYTVQNNQKQVFLSVPAYMIGYPVFDRSLATIYLKRQLIRNKLEVIQISEFDFHVSWEKKKKKKKKEKQTSVDLDDDENFPSLINLRKAASKYK